MADLESKNEVASRATSKDRSTNLHQAKGTQMSSIELQSRIAGRKYGDGLVDIWVEKSEPKIGSKFEELADRDAFMTGVARAFREWSDSILGQPFSESKVMTKTEAERYESNCIRFGKYLGTPIKEIPLDYLQWLADAQNELCAYLRSEIGRKRQQVEGQP